MSKRKQSPWYWMPSLYFAEGIPYIIVMTLSVIMYKRLGISNTDIALYTSWLYLPWVIKPLWSPIVDIYHRFALPHPVSDKPNKAQGRSVIGEFLETFVSFFKKKEIGVALLFLLLYRLAESQIVKMASPFLLDAREVGGLGITTGDLGVVYGTAGIIALTIGGILVVLLLPVKALNIGSGGWQ